MRRFIIFAILFILATSLLFSVEKAIMCLVLLGIGVLLWRPSWLRALFTKKKRVRLQLGKDGLIGTLYEYNEAAGSLDLQDTDNGGRYVFAILDEGTSRKKAEILVGSKPYYERIPSGDLYTQRLYKVGYKEVYFSLSEDARLSDELIS